MKEETYEACISMSKSQSKKEGKKIITTLNIIITMINKVLHILLTSRFSFFFGHFF